MHFSVVPKLGKEFTRKEALPEVSRLLGLMEVSVSICKCQW